MKQLNNLLFIVDLGHGVYGETTLTVKMFDLVYGDMVAKPLKIRGNYEVEYFAVEVYESIKNYRPSKIMFCIQYSSQLKLEHHVRKMIAGNHYIKMNRSGDLFYRE